MWYFGAFHSTTPRIFCNKKMTQLVYFIFSFLNFIISFNYFENNCVSPEICTLFGSELFVFDSGWHFGVFFLLSEK